MEDSEESEEDENIKKSVAERREQIQKRLSIERQIPASTQKKEIVQEITEIKRQSLIEDKKALHEEEIIMHAPTDNIIKSTSIPEQIMKLKSNIKETVDVSKTEFDKELQDKFKTAIKGIEDFEHKASDDVTTELPQTVQIESLESDSKIYYDSTNTEKSSTGVDKKYTEELKTEKTVSSSEVVQTKESIKSTVTKVESTKPDTVIKTVEESLKQASKTEQKSYLDNKRTTDHVIETKTDISETTKSLQRETEEKSIRDKSALKTLKTESTETKKTVTSIIDATREFIESELTGKPVSQNEFVVSDLVREEAKDSVQSGSKATSIVVTSESETKSIIDPDLSKPQSTAHVIAEEVKTTVRTNKEVFSKDTNEDEFFKTIEAKITKKMSQDLTLIKDDIASIGKCFFLKYVYCISIFNRFNRFNIQ